MAEIGYFTKSLNTGRRLESGLTILQGGLVTDDMVLWLELLLSQRTSTAIKESDKKGTGQLYNGYHSFLT